MRDQNQLASTNDSGEEDALSKRWAAWKSRRTSLREGRSHRVARVKAAALGSPLEKSESDDSAKSSRSLRALVAKASLLSGVSTSLSGKSWLALSADIGAPSECYSHRFVVTVCGSESCRSSTTQRSSIPAHGLEQPVDASTTAMPHCEDLHSQASLRRAWVADSHRCSRDVGSAGA
mmetsp:Transcript_44619/g.105794  ORF Transcript_44619/g.105794 Transcript_44619/m.105794 type:complete len:177 (-) Transcript_44619:207-737(-)